MTNISQFRVGLPRNKISVVVSAHKDDNFIMTLRALQRQTYKPYQVIVSDNANGSFEGITRSFGYEYVKTDKPSRSIAKNTGFSLVKGNLTWFIDEDIIPTYRCLEVINNWYNKPERLKTTLNGTVNRLVMHGFHYTEIPDSAFERLIMERGGRDIWQAIDWRVPSNSFCCPTEALREIMSEYDKPFDERFEGYGDEDIELDYRLYLKGFKMFIAQPVLVYHRQHKIDFKKNIDTAKMNLLYFLRKHNCDEEIVRASKPIWSAYFGLDGDKLLEEARKE